MKVVLFNGSRREKGCTYTALSLVAGELKAAGIETEIFFVGGRVLKGETDTVVHEAKEILKTADAVVYGSPVYYASPSGEMLMFLDRLYGIAETGFTALPKRNCSLSPPQQLLLPAVQGRALLSMH